MNQKPIEMSQKSVDSLKEELTELEQVKLPTAVKRVAKAREQGDLSENSEYHDARDEQEFIEVRIGEIQEILAHVKIVKEKTGGNKVTFGSEVELKDDKGKKKTYFVVGEYDDSAGHDNTITSESPIGSAVLGKTKGAEVEVTVPNGIRKFTITAVK